MIIQPGFPWCRKNQEFPDFGTDTQSAIAAGVQQGIVFELNGYIHLFERQIPGMQVRDHRW